MDCSEGFWTSPRHGVTCDAFESSVSALGVQCGCRGPAGEGKAEPRCGLHREPVDVDSFPCFLCFSYLQGTKRREPSDQQEGCCLLKRLAKSF